MRRQKWKEKKKNNKNLYISKINSDQVDATGVQDIPFQVPFSIASESAVYYRHASNSNLEIRVFKTAYDYQSTMLDDDFSRVMTVEDVAKEGYDALMRKEVIRIPGLSNQAAVSWAKHQPRWLVRGLGGMLARLRR